nr:MAG TPA: hypothetical protein [Herelleviridae sp.]
MHPFVICVESLLLFYWKTRVLCRLHSRFPKSKPYKVRPEIYSTEPDSLTALPGSLFNSFLFRRYPP